MIKKNKLLLTAFSSALMLLVLSSSLVSAPAVIGTLYCCTTTAGITIDGVLKPTEWIDGKPLGVTLFDLSNQANKLDIEIMTVLDRDNQIYFGVTIPDSFIDGEEYFYIVFDDAEGTPIVADPSPEGKFGAYHDLKVMWVHNNHTTDAYTTGVGFEWKDDISNSGVENTVGKCFHNGTHLTIEIKTNIHTGDTAGYDFNVAVNNSINIFLWYHNPSAAADLDFTQIREADGDYDVIKLLISCTDLSPLPIQSVILGILGVTIFTAIYKKKRQ
ncbi:MAG: hypothetical protein ACFFDW_16560 [Candidatus Thorarchaeota archaeon]